MGLGRIHRIVAGFVAELAILACAALLTSQTAVALLLGAGVLVAVAIAVDAAVRVRRALRGVAAEQERQSLHDRLTGLPNRALLVDRLEEAVGSARATGERLGLLLMDLDRFKDVNATFGHRRGDGVLVDVAERLAAIRGEGDTLARLGGDEFALLASGAGEADAGDAATRMLDALRAPFDLEGTPIEVGASIGVALYPDHGEDADTLLRRADVAMYQAKRGEQGHAVYVAEDDDSSPERLALIADLRRGIAAGELELHYQPKVNCADREVHSVEALVRWRHPRHGMVPPDRFIGLAEQTGLIRDLTEWVLGEALHQCAAWDARGISVDVAVNVSARNLRDATLPDLVGGLLSREGLAPTRLIVEITENALMIEPRAAHETMARLREMGVRIAIDDFGTGYASLSYLQRLPAHELKIDRSFVKGLAADHADAAIVRSTISLGHDLGLSVVAEGVEDSETLDLLSRAGCDVAQGYVLTRPVPPAELVDWLLHSPWASRRDVRGHLRAA
jgi:diguanylate cyclase (GGDEF)-like protein